MKKQLLIGLATGLFFYGMTSTAMALNFAGNATGTFENPDGPAGFLASGQNPFLWGNEANWGTGPSWLSFDSTPFLTVDDGTPFELGTLEYFNGTIDHGSGATSVDLNIGLMFSAPSGLAKQDFIFSLDLINTINYGTSDFNDADFVSLPSAYSGTIFSQGNTDYTLSLSFGEVTSGGGISSTDQFHVYEGERAIAKLMGTITSDVAPVPEPATMLLFGTGMAGLAGYRRRQQAKKK